MTIFDVIRYPVSCPVRNSELGRLPDDVLEEYREQVSTDLTLNHRQEHKLILSLLLKR